MPFLMMLGGLGFLLGTGGGALIAKTMGERRQQQANRLFSMVVYISLICGVILSVGGILLLRPLARAMGAEGVLLENSVRYGQVILLAIPVYILQYEFQCLFATAGKPKLGLYVTVAAGVTNMVLDWLFVAVLPWGLEGAAAATAISQCVGGIIPLVYFDQPAAAGTVLSGRTVPGPDLPERLFRTAEQHLHVPGEYALQHPAAALCRGGWNCRLWGADVCEHDLSGTVHRLLRGLGTGGELSLRGSES